MEPGAIIGIVVAFIVVITLSIMTPIVFLKPNSTPTITPTPAARSSHEDVVIDEVFMPSAEPAPLIYKLESMGTNSPFTNSDLDLYNRLSELTPITLSYHHVLPEYELVIKEVEGQRTLLKITDDKVDKINCPIQPESMSCIHHEGVVYIFVSDHGKTCICANGKWVIPDREASYWVPVIFMGELAIIHSLSPLCILQINMDNGETSRMFGALPDNRGDLIPSTPLVVVGEYYWGVAHHVGGGPKVYRINRSTGRFRSFSERYFEVPPVTRVLEEHQGQEIYSLELNDEVVMRCNFGKESCAVRIGSLEAFMEDPKVWIESSSTPA